MTLVVLLLYLLVLLIIGFFSFRKIDSFSDFFVARNKGTVKTITGSLVATILGGSAIIGTIDEGTKYGWAAMWFMLSASIGLLFLLPLVKKVKKLGKFTLPELLGDMYGPKLKLISSIIIPLAWLGITAAQIIASAKILQSFTGLDYYYGVIVSGSVFVLYTIAGGQISILKTDFVQALLVIASIVLLLVFTANFASFNNVFAYELSFPFNKNFGLFDLFILIITYSLTFTAGPDIYSRIFSANNENTARKSVLATAIILVPVAIIIGFLATYSASEGITPNNGSVIIQLSKQLLPNWVVPVMVLGLLSALLSSADTTLLSASIIIVGLVDKNKYNQRSIRKTRLAILTVGALSIAIAINYSSIIGILLFALTIYSGAFIVPTIVGLLGFSVKSSYASIAVISGGFVAFVGKTVFYNGNTLVGNILIVAAFAVNGLILLMGRREKNQKI